MCSMLSITNPYPIQSRIDIAMRDSIIKPAMDTDDLLGNMLYLFGSKFP